jgi:hypothetical protein
VTDPSSPAGPIRFFSAGPVPTGQQAPLPGTLWSASLWDGSRPLVIIPLEVVEDLGQQISLRGVGIGIASVLGVIRTLRIHAPSGQEYGPIPCCLTSDAKKNPAALPWGNVVVIPGAHLTFGGITLHWQAG